MLPQQEFDLFPLDGQKRDESGPIHDWLWHGYLARAKLTIFTSLWKAGKTTLIAGLLNRLAAGGEFLGQPCQAARVIVVSEESKADWTDRSREIPLGPHVQLLARPFPGQPSVEDWQRLIDFARARRAAGELDLFIVDTLGQFLPGHSESDPGTLRAMLHPLRRLADDGVAVLILHHPRKAPAEEGHTARGSGALLAYADIILELHRTARLKAENNIRRLIGLSRHRVTPPTLWYEWTLGTPTFTLVDDPHVRRYKAHWGQLEAVLKKRKSGIFYSVPELLEHWPDGADKPARTQLYDWLTRAWEEEKRVKRTGHGTKGNPYKYRLPNEDDAYYAKGRLPPLKPLKDIFQSIAEED